MNRLGKGASLGRTQRAREPVDVPEAKRPDKSLDTVLNVRKNRVTRFERERLQAREEWRDARTRLNEAKHRWRDALSTTQQKWQQAREEFFRMSTTSGQFRQAKAVYERMKAQAGQLRLEAREAARGCREAGGRFFDATRQLAQMRRQQEKLTLLRDEIRAQQLNAEQA